MLRNAFFLEFGPPPTPRKANNIEPYTFVTLFSGKFDTTPPPSALRKTWMAAKGHASIYFLILPFSCPVRQIMIRPFRQSWQQNSSLQTISVLRKSIYAHCKVAKATLFLSIHTGVLSAMMRRLYVVNFFLECLCLEKQSWGKKSYYCPPGNVIRGYEPGSVIVVWPQKCRHDEVYGLPVKIHRRRTLFFDDAPSNDNRPLSRRLDRCDRMIQNEGHDSRKLFTLKKALCR